MNIALDFAEIVSPLYQEALVKVPEHHEHLYLSNRVDWAFSMLFGRYGRKQVPLVCDSSGLLQVDDDAVHTHVHSMDAKLSGDGALRMKDGSTGSYASVSASGVQAFVHTYSGAEARVVSADNALVGYNGTVICSYHLKQLYDILTDVHDAVNHYLKTHET